MLAGGRPAVKRGQILRSRIARYGRTIVGYRGNLGRRARRIRRDNGARQRFSRRPPMIWIRRILLALLLLAALALGAVYLGLRASLPVYDGETKSAVRSPVELLRDERGYLTVKAATRADAARALGYAHAQERFFQMDLLRRNAAGELAALVGARAQPVDEGRRIHRFRHRAQLALATLPPEQRRLLQVYAEGVNEGLAQLGAKPFEYTLLRQQPAAWLPQDSLLVVLSMYLDLQHMQGRDELAMGALKEAVPADWYRFLTQHSADWQAAIDGSQVAALPLPESAWPEALRTAAKVACRDCGLMDSRDIGSNNFAVAGQLTPHGGAILADDMHLGIRVPNTWFKARLEWTEGERQRSVTGVTLPGTPVVSAGSNGQVAWGFTNATADWTDVIALKLDKDGKHYASPGGDKPVQVFKERIEVAGGSAVEIEVRETEWGPIMAKPFERYALRWVAHDVEGLNLRVLAMEQVATVGDAMQQALGAGMPAQNLLVADARGQIGWTLIAALPRRFYAEGADMDTPQDWSTGATRWQGYLGADDNPPRIVNPADGRLWTANARSVGGPALALIGNGGYDLGARGQQIRDGLRAKDKLDEAALHEIQLDHRALFLQRWRKLLLDDVLTPEFVAKHGLADYRRAIETSADAARPDAQGYAYVRAFRVKLLERLFAPLASLMEKRQLKLSDLKLVPETPGWALIQARRADAIAGGNWKELFEQIVLDTRSSPVWGEANRARIEHPLAAAIPYVGHWLNMPATPLAGDRHMPRVQLNVHGQSERMVVSPGHEDRGILILPGGQSGHPLSPFYRADHQAWLDGKPVPFLPGAQKHRLVLKPD